MKKTEKYRDLLNSILLLSKEILEKDQKDWTFWERVFIHNLDEMKHEFIAERRELSEMFPMEEEESNRIIH